MRDDEKYLKMRLSTTKFDVLSQRPIDANSNLKQLFRMLRIDL